MISLVLMPAVVVWISRLLTIYRVDPDTKVSWQGTLRLKSISPVWACPTLVVLIGP
jgi:hypothetical protein